MKHLLKHFKDLSIHPKNAAELKALILQLAVQGKLTTDSSNWHFGILSDLGNWAIGSGFPKAKQGIDNEEILFAKVSDMNIDGNSKFITKTNNTISRNTASEIRAKIHPKGTIVFPKIGGAIATNKRRILIKPTCIDNNCLGIVPNKSTTTEWIFLVLSSIDMTKYQSGTSVPSLSQKILEKIPSSVPPLEEQKAIVSTVNTLFAEVEQLEALTKERIQLKEAFVTSALQQLTNSQSINGEWAFLQQHFPTFFTEVPNIKKLRESILQLAVQGKLTTHWRKKRTLSGVEVEDASVLLERIKEEKAQQVKVGKIKKGKPLPEITSDEIPYTLPESWVWCRLGEITDIIAGASFKSGDFNNTGGTKCIKITNAGVREFVETEDYLPQDFVKLYPNYLIKEGDLILALTRPYIKDGLKISVCPSSYHHSLLNQRVASIRSLTDKVYLIYIFTFIQSPKVLNFYKSKFDGKSQQPNMKMGDLTDLAIALPPIAEQQAIVEKVNTLMALCDLLEQEIKSCKAIQEDWMKSSLREVFVESSANKEPKSYKIDGGLSMVAEP